MTERVFDNGAGKQAEPLSIVVPGLDDPALDQMNALLFQWIAVLDERIKWRTACPDAKATRHRVRGALIEAIALSNISINFQNAHEQENRQ